MNPQPASRNPQAERILVRGVNWLGDAVMSTPALLRLREARRDARITLLTHEKLADLWWGHPAVDAVITFGAGESVWRVAQKLRGEQFDVGVALPNSHRAALELWLAAIPKRVGHAAPFRRRLLTHPLSHRTDAMPMRKRPISEIRSVIRRPGAVQQRPSRPGAHHLHQYLHLVAALGASPTPLAPFLMVDDRLLGEVRSKFGLTAGVRWLGLHPGAEYGPAKRWPAERFAHAAVETQRGTNYRWIILGGPADEPAATEVTAGMHRAFAALPDHAGHLAPPLQLVGRTTLRELCAVLKCCQLVLTNDSGPMHVAAAVGTPVVALFGSTDPELTGPGLPGDPRHRVVRGEVTCSPCFRRECPVDLRCLQGISMRQVVEAIRDLLTQSDGSAGPGNADS